MKRMSKTFVLGLLITSFSFGFTEGVAQIKNGNEPTKSKKASSDDMVHLDFTDVEIREVVKAISKITGRNFVLDDRVRGKITIISPEPVSVREAYQAFVSALEVKNFTTVQEGKIIKIIPIREAKSSPIPSGPNSEVPFGAGFITRLIPIRYISANEIALSLKSLVSPNGSITAYGPTNSLIVTDSSSNIRRLMKIISKLDRRGFKEGIEVIPLTYASAPEIAKILLDLFQVQKAKKAATPKRRSRGSQDIEGGQVISKIIPDERTNSLIVIANREGVEKVLNVVRRLDHEIELEEGKGRIHVHYLEHADAEELAQTLSGLTQSTTRRPTRTPARPNPANRRSSSRNNNRNARTSNTRAGSVSLFKDEVKISPDVATNSLVITASPQDYESLKPILKKLDIPRRQVFVEAVILEVDIDKMLDVGLNVNSAGGVGDDAGVFGGTIFNQLNTISLNSPESLSSAAGAAGGAALGGLFGIRGRDVDIPGLGSIPLYGAIFRALQTDNILNVLSTPNILTTDNKPAEILIGDNVPILQSSGSDSAGNPIQTFDRRDVGISLKVTPQINESNFVTMDIEQKIETVSGPSTQGTPTFSTRSAQTTVVVEDQQTIVIGGLISEQEKVSKGKVPVLGDIPLLGWFFQNKSKERSRNNLMIFITPTVVKDMYDAARVTREKEIQRQRFNRKNRVEEPKGYRDYGVRKRIKIDRDKGSSRSNKRKGGTSSRFVAPQYEEGTAGYSEGYIIDDRFGDSERGSDGESPFDEIVPPSSN